jgi:hypothetical protein
MEEKGKEAVGRDGKEEWKTKETKSGDGAGRGERSEEWKMKKR